MAKAVEKARALQAEHWALAVANRGLVRGVLRSCGIPLREWDEWVSDVGYDGLLRAARKWNVCRGQYSTFATHVVFSAVHNRLRKLRRRGPSEVADGAGRPMAYRGEVPSRVEDRDELAFLMAGLSPGSRLALQLRYGEGLTMAQTGQTIGVCRETTRQILRRALEHCRRRAGTACAELAKGTK